MQDDRSLQPDLIEEIWGDAACAMHSVDAWSANCGGIIHLDSSLISIKPIIDDDDYDDDDDDDDEHTSTVEVCWDSWFHPGDFRGNPQDGVWSARSTAKVKVEDLSSPHFSAQDLIDFNDDNSERPMSKHANEKLADCFEATSGDEFFEFMDGDCGSVRDWPSPLRDVAMKMIRERASEILGRLHAGLDLPQDQAAPTWGEDVDLICERILAGESIHDLDALVGDVEPLPGLLARDYLAGAQELIEELPHNLRYCGLSPNDLNSLPPQQRAAAMKILHYTVEQSLADIYTKLSLQADRSSQSWGREHAILCERVQADMYLEEIEYAVEEAAEGAPGRSVLSYLVELQGS